MPQQPNSDNTVSYTTYDTLSQDVKKAIESFAVQDDAYRHERSDLTPVYIFFTVLFIGMVLQFRYNLRHKKYDNESLFEEDEEPETTTVTEKNVLTYYGEELDFSDEVYNTVLCKYCSYYNRLNDTDKNKFLNRLKKFIASKNFIIHDSSGYREMPILVSAAAIQLSFGLQHYLLPNFNNIHIYPAEFIGVSPTIRVLAGNVSGHSIHISWKHFLEGFQNPTDGSNVGLHELAHAYYFQNFETEEQVDADFVAKFADFNEEGNIVFEKEKSPHVNLYSDYAMKNFQEFWAESVEIFFEKPEKLKEEYPDFYEAISGILNQDPMG